MASRSRGSLLPGRRLLLRQARRPTISSQPRGCRESADAGGWYGTTAFARRRGRAAQFQGVEGPVTGMEFVWVPGGCYQMGSSESDGERDTDETPIIRYVWMVSGWAAPR